MTFLAIFNEPDSALVKNPGLYYAKAAAQHPRFGQMLGRFLAVTDDRD
jgi:hypothetical protein